MLKFQQERNKLFFATLSLPATAMGLALTAQLSALSWILVTQYNFDVHDIGFVWAAGPLAGIFGQVIIGGLSDKVWFWNGRRRPFIIIGGVVAALSLLALPRIGVISTALGLEAIVGVALIIALTLDFAVNVGFNPTRSIIADVTPEGDERTRGFTWMQTVSGSFGVAGYAIATIFDNYVLIYTSAIIVLLFTIIPPLLIEEPRELVVEEAEETKKPLWELVMSIQPLWGFLIYDAYAMSLRLAGVETDHYYAEIVCGILTLVLVAKVLFARADDDGSARSHHLGFQKVLAAHSFSWIGIHTTFVYLIIFLQQQFPELGDIDSGRVNSLNFLILNLVGALLPLFVLQPLALKIGRVKTHAAALAVMAAAYFALYFSGQTVMSVYVMIAFVGVGWASIVSLPFAIVSQKVQSTEMGLYMGLFNLSVVLPQLTVSLGVAMLVSRAADKDIIFLVSAVTVALSALAWTRVSEETQAGAAEPAPGGHH